MTAGLPVLTSDRGGTGEVAGDAALLVDPENHRDIAAGMVRLAFEADLRERLALAGRIQSRKWSWSSTADLTVSVYRQLLAERSG